MLDRSIWISPGSSEPQSKSSFDAHRGRLIGRIRPGPGLGMKRSRSGGQLKGSFGYLFQIVIASGDTIVSQVRRQFSLESR